MRIWHKVRGYLATGVALVACPCHLVLTLPLLLTLTAGTALGAFLSRNTGLIIVASTATFIGGLLLAFRWLGEGEQTCSLPAANPPNRNHLVEGQSKEEVSVL